MATELGINYQKEVITYFTTYHQPVKLELLNPKYIFIKKFVISAFYYPPYELALSSKLVEMVKKYKIDLLMHIAPYRICCIYGKKIFYIGINIPIVTTLHGTDITLLVVIHPKNVEFSINKSDYVTAVSKSLKEDTINCLI